jgi:hypothetical protein
VALYVSWNPEQSGAMELGGANNRLLRTLEAACRKIIGRKPRKDDLVHSVREYVVQRLAEGAPPFDVCLLKKPCGHGIALPLRRD